MEVNPHRLPCGRDVADVFAELDIGQVSRHSRDCAHCRSAAASLSTLRQATAAMANDPADPPDGLIERIMSAVRAELGRGTTLTLPADLGPAEISTRAVAVVLRYAADTVDGVRARRCTVELDPDDPTVAHITMSIALRFGTGPVHSVTREVRDRIAAAFTSQIGLRAGSVDLELVDVWDETPR